MNKNFYIVILLFLSNLWGEKCGCSDDYLVPSFIKLGSKQYDVHDKHMLSAFMKKTIKMKEYYEKFENKTSKFLEDSAKLNYLEGLSSKEELFDFSKNSHLKALQIDSTNSKQKILK